MLMKSVRTVVVAAMMAAILILAGGDGLRVEVRTQVMSWEPLFGVCVAEECG
ncbi:hypothetical protein BH11PLA2_BH11PLA2_29020 [soil metagenome]